MPWYLGFDCATKTFAFSLSWIDIEAYRVARERLTKQLCIIQKLMASTNAQSQSQKLISLLESMDKETKSFINIADGEVVDFFPGQADDDIHTVERIRAVVKYVASRIRPSIANVVPAGEKLHVVVEFQMGSNAKARTVSSALIALFAEDDVILVGPSLKNKIAT